MPPTVPLESINGVALLTKAGKPKTRYSPAERLKLVGGKKKFLRRFIKLFCPDRPLYAATKRGTADPRAWTTPRGRLPDGEVLRHLVGNATPGILPRWVAPHCWEATRWVAIDVDFRGDVADFKRRCQQVLQAFEILGVHRKAVLKSPTPSGGRHFRFFTTQKVRVLDIPRVMEMVGLKEAAGQIEIFPKPKKGMRLPFGYIPGRPFDPNRSVRFIRAFENNRIQKFSWLKCSLKASEHLTKLLENSPGIPASQQQVTKPLVQRDRHKAPLALLGIPKKHRGRLAAPAQQEAGRYHELLSRPVASPEEATELLSLGICAKGTRLEATKRLAWHLLFVRQLSRDDASKLLVDWVYQTGRTTSVDVEADIASGKRCVEEQTRQLVSWMIKTHAWTGVPEKERSHFSEPEAEAVRLKLRGYYSTCATTLLSVALNFLRYAKLHGQATPEGWIAQVAVNGVIRRWPGCRGLGSKRLIDTLKASGLVEMTKEKRQSANGTGRPRTYLVRIDPQLRKLASMTHDQAMECVARNASYERATQFRVLTSELFPDAYRRSISPSPSEKLKENSGSARQEEIMTKGTPDPALERVRQFRIRESEALRKVIEHHSSGGSSSEPKGPPGGRYSPNRMRLPSRKKRFKQAWHDPW